MLDHQTHFASSFEIRSDQLSNHELWSAVVHEIRGWLSNKKLPRRPDVQKFLAEQWFHRGSSDAQRIGHHSLTTRSFAGSFVPECPEHWSLRYEHDDSEGKVRRWRTDIGLTRAEHGLHFSISVSHFVEDIWYGPALAAPTHSVPGVVRDILCTNRPWKGMSGRNQLYCKAFRISSNSVNLLVDSLIDKERRVPLVVISNVEASGLPLIDPAELAKSVAGIALVFHFKDTAAKRLFDSSLPDKFRVFNGAIRSYQPNLNINRFQDSYRHRYFTEADLNEQGLDVVGSAIVRSSLRRDRGDVSAAVLTLEDVGFRAFTANLAKDSSNASLIQPLFAELDNQKEKYDSLFNDYQNVFEEWEESVRTKSDLEEELREQERTLGALRYQLRNLGKKAADVAVETSFADATLAATGGTKIVCVRSKQDSSYTKAIAVMFSLSESDVELLFEEVETEHSSNQVSYLMNTYKDRVLVYAWGHLKSIDASESQGFRQYFEGQSTRKALHWLGQWLDKLRQTQGY